ncbi:YspD [Yersinia nurmii]|uniref:YspD n=1 Tax=Yersinia nurmii TaxID=685706 RepID=A0ABM9SLP4_9GAMM|nr:IpaD/SipD/SspD family type III secretion system needle tip protein [Yersinia nurmii]CNF06949.1 YspD [Yersinia nurmii]
MIISSGSAASIKPNASQTESLHSQLNSGGGDVINNDFFDSIISRYSDDNDSSNLRRDWLNLLASEDYGVRKFTTLEKTGVTKGDTQRLINRLSDDIDEKYEVLSSDYSHDEINIPPHIKSLIEVVDIGYEDFQSKHKEIVEKYSKYYEAFSEGLSTQSKYVGAGSDANKIDFKKRSFAASLNDKLIIYSNESSFYNTETGRLNENAFSNVKALYTLTGDEKRFNYWKKELSPELNVTWDEEKGCIYILPNLDNLKSIFKSLENSDGVIRNNHSGNDDIATATYQAWQAGNDSIKNRQQNALNQLTEKYGHHLNKLENLIQFLIRAIEDHAKSNEPTLRILA